MRQSKDDLEKGYETPDPWGYQRSPVDIERKRLIVGICKLFAPIGLFNVALDVGCGEGWITRDLPARKLYGYELSQRARARFPVNVCDAHKGWLTRYDLVTCMGALYAEYDHADLIAKIRNHAHDVIVISGIKDWELPIDLEKAFGARQVFEAEFPYHRPESEYTQQVRVFRKCQ